MCAWIRASNRPIPWALVDDYDLVLVGAATELVTRSR